MPAFAILGNSPLSGSTAGLVMIACVGSWLLYAHGGQPGWGILASFLVGVGVWFKTGFVFFVPLLVFASLAPKGISLSRKMRGLVVHGVVSAIGVAPVLVYNWVSFGSPLRTGYHYWSIAIGPGPLANFGETPRFALSNVWPRLVDLGREAFGVPTAFNTANIFASGSWMGASFVLLLTVAVAIALRRRAWLAIVAGSSGYLLSMLCYYRYFGRLYFPLLLIGALAVGPLVGSVANLRLGVWRRVCSVALGGLLVASVVGFSRPGAPLELPRLLETARFERQVATNFLLAREVRAQVKGEDCLIVTDLLTPFMSAIVGPPVRVVSLEGERPFSFRREYKFSVEARDAEILGAVRDHGCVIVALAGQFSDLDQKLPAGDGFHWATFYRINHRGNREYGAARLARSRQSG